MEYVVPNMVLIAQDNNNACWYASALMVRGAKIANTKSCRVGPHQIPRFASLHNSQQGIPWAEIRMLAQGMGLTPAPLMSPTVSLLESWLREKGALWLDGVPVDRKGNKAGNGHVVVIAGIRTTGASTEILIYDPWPPGVGDVSWWPISRLATILSDGANMNRDAFFLYYNG